MAHPYYSDTKSPLREGSEIAQCCIEKMKGTTCDIDRTCILEWNLGSLFAISDQEKAIAGFATTFIELYDTLPSIDERYLSGRA